MVQPIQYNEIFYSSYSLSVENLNLTVTLDGGAQTKTVKPTPLHNHPVFELQAILAGEMALDFSETESILLSRKDICLIPPDLYHGVSPSEDAARITLRFSFMRNAEQTNENFYLRFSRLTEATVLKDCEEMISLLESIRREILSHMAESAALCRAYLSALFVLLYRRLGEQCPALAGNLLSESDDENARYNKIELLMHWRMAEIFREEDLAEALGLSVRQTSRVMQKIFGMSFRKKLLELRLHHAKGLLLTSDCPVEEIADIVGYTSPSGFHIAFRKAFGCTPRDYREKNFRQNFNNGT